MDTGIFATFYEAIGVTEDRVIPGFDEAWFEFYWSGYG